MRRCRPSSMHRRRPRRSAEPRLVVFNRPLATALGLDAEALDGPEGAAIFAGNAVPDGGRPIAQAYAGHQFGYFTALGDGRAILLGEQITPSGDRVDIQLKGPGRTPFSTRGDGRAALGPMLREYIISEAMHALGIPTTRSLAVVTTGEAVYRDTQLDGAVLTRVAASHIRVGTMQWAAAHQDRDALQALADYTLARHYPQLAAAPEPYIALFDAILERQARLIARWQLVGFIHGVMNTDNMALSGETIDYGPCAFMDRYDPADRVQLDRFRRPLCLREPAADRALEPRQAGRGDGAAVRRRPRSGRRACHGRPRPLPGPVRAALARRHAREARTLHRRGWRQGARRRPPRLDARPVGRLHEHVRVADRRTSGRGRRRRRSRIRARGIAAGWSGAPVSRSRPPTRRA